MYKLNTSFITGTTPNNGRQSILMRPTKKGNTNFNKENIDVEYQKEQAKLDAKRRRLEMMNEHRRKTFYGSVNEKAQLKENRRNEISDHLNIRQNLKNEERIEELKISSKMNHHLENLQTIEQEKTLARREYMKSVMKDNLKLIDYRNKVKQSGEITDKYKAQSEVEFFDRYKSFR